VNNDFKILVDFIGGLGPEVSGRVLEAPHTEAALKLGRFAVGEVDEEERHEVCTMLQLHPAWLRYLADRVKQSRVVQSEDGREDT
jgi:hypothetical protein